MGKKTFKTKEEFLQDNLNYFWGKPERLSLNYLNECVYTPEGESEGCAIGRHISLKLAKKLDNIGGASNFTAFNLLPKWMQKLEQDFLVAMQDLHDFQFFTDKNKEGILEKMKPFVDMSKIVFPE
jgi:hypothetical protein